MTFPLPADEAERLQALRRYEILDTPPEPSFDRIASLARRLLRVPIALVSLVDHDRQWFKSSQGLESLSEPQIPRDISFCAHTIVGQQVLVVPDATRDERFASNPLVVSGLQIRFYAGAPLVGREGHSLGTLAIADVSPRELSPDDEATLRELAAMVTELLEARLEKSESRQAREESQERLRLLESVVVTANDAILITQAEPVEEPGPRILYVNAAFTRMTGYTLEDVLGKTPRILQGQGTAYESREKIRQALKRWKPIQIELLNYRKDGTPFWVELSIVPVANEAGWFTHWVSVQRDTSERRESEAALREIQTRLERTTANLPGMVYQFVLHQDGSIDWPFVSEGSRDLYGLEPLFIQHHPNFLLDRIDAEDHRVFNDSVLRSATTLEPWQWEGKFLHPSGEERWAQAAARPKQLSNGDVLWDGVTLDITDRKRAEAALQLSKEEAESARESAEAANRAKSEFLSRMSHELRTPLNAILGFGQLFELSELSRDDRESADQILKAGRHLLGLINEVLDISRIEAGRLEMSIEPVRVREVVREVLDLANPLARARGVSLQEAVEESAHVLADCQRLKQVLLNLVSNAVKYNVPGGKVRISCVQVLERQMPAPQVLAGHPVIGRLSIEVSDSGPGIAPDDIGKLFTPFERLGARNSGVEGTGIGLALSKRLTELMDGRIHVRSELGQGSTFCVEMPQIDDPSRHNASHTTPGEVAEPQQSDDAQVQAALCTVLYIEDNLSNLKLVERILARRPEVRLLASMQGRLGLDLAREQRPDLILLDLHLPDLNGDQVLAHLQEDPHLRHIPVVILSADATPQQVQRLLSAGARAYLTKPLDMKQFLQTLEEHLPSKHLPPMTEH